MATARDKKRVGEGPVPFVLLDRPGAARPGCAVAPRELIAAVRELRPTVGERLHAAVSSPDVRNRIEVMHGVNLDQLGRRDPGHYGALTLTELELQISEPPPSSAWRRASSRPTTRASSSSTCTASRDWRTRIVLNPGAWTHYS